MSHWTIVNDTICNDVAMKIVPVQHAIAKTGWLDKNQATIIVTFWTPIKNTKRVASFQDTQKIVRSDMSFFVATLYRSKSSEKIVQYNTSLNETVYMIVSLSNQKCQTLLTWDVQSKMAKVWNIQDLIEIVSFQFLKWSLEHVKFEW